jgi:regulator of nucleoside diphosphate kinase
MQVLSPLERTLTQLDYVRLTRLLDGEQVADNARSPEGRSMEDLLAISELVAGDQVAPDVITMYSQVLLAGGEDSEPYKLTLCYPEDAEPAAGFISVLSPVGLALLGLRVGSIARWRMPTGNEGMAEVRAILFQPEASGDYTT